MAFQSITFFCAAAHLLAPDPEAMLSQTAFKAQVAAITPRLQEIVRTIEDEDDAPASSRVEDEEAPPSPSVASSDGGLNQFAKMRLIERARRATSGRSSSGARQHGAPRNSLNSLTHMSAFALPRDPQRSRKNDSEARSPKRFRPGGQRSTMGVAAGWSPPDMSRSRRCRCVAGASAGSPIILSKTRRGCSDRIINYAHIR